MSTAAAMISIPAFFDQTLAGCRRERAMIDEAVADFSGWFSTSGTRFFSDYTDHGSDHITSVLATCEALIPPAARIYISQSDIAVLCLGAILHDSAMHLSDNGFYELVKGSYRHNRIREFDRDTWDDLWAQFLFSARRWDDAKLKSVLGINALKSGFRITDPFERWEDLRGSDYKLIGEFIRQHHPRLAHQFAIFGVPASSTHPLGLPSAVPSDWKDIIGVVARSHGMSLRTAVDYVSDKYHKREYQGIHAAYLMVLLRLADYLQIDSSRAPSLVFRYRVIPSKTSELEWFTHACVKNITAEAEDPESVEIEVLPTQIEVYLRLREWLEGIQSEMDISWAVLGEIYGSSQKLKNLGILWRRVRSNIDPDKIKEDNFNFLPKRVRIEAARAELLALLIAPLYGDDPAFGIRELLQNSVDAVNEREYLLNRQNNDNALDWEGSIKISVEKTGDNLDSDVFVIEDNGIGMTDETLVKYFLTAGASFRNSETWKKYFESEEQIESLPKSNVIRSGRFGVGALAAFLLGDEIHVSTRHMLSSIGYQFRVSLSDTAIQVEKTTGLKIGTRISIPISAETRDKILEDFNRKHVLVAKPPNMQWYSLKKPTVEHFFNGSKVTMARPTVDLKSWRVAPLGDSLTLHWSYGGDLPSLQCNGIFISDSKKLPLVGRRHTKDTSFTVITPALHVTDPDGMLPLSLKRSEVRNSEYGFERELAISVVDDFLCRLLMKMPESFLYMQLQSVISTSPLAHSGTRSGFGYDGVMPGLLLSAKGFCIPFPKAFDNREANFHRCLWTTGLGKLSHLKNIDNWDLVILEERGLESKFRPQILKMHEKGDISAFCVTVSEPSQKLEAGEPAGDGQVFETPSKSSPLVRKSWLVGSVKDLMGNERWVKHCILRRTEGFTSVFADEGNTKKRLSYFADFTSRSSFSFELSEGFLSRRWVEIFGETWIPWSKIDRERMLKQSFAKLQAYHKFYS